MITPIDDDLLEKEQKESIDGSAPCVMAAGNIRDFVHISDDYRVLRRPMSMAGRVILDWVLTHIRREADLGRFNAVKYFMDEVDPLIYDNTALKYHFKNLPNVLKMARLDKVRITNLDVARRIYNLTDLFEESDTPLLQWPTNDKYISKFYSFRISRNAAAIDAYNYITTQWMVADYNIFNMVRLSEICKEYSLDLIKEICERSGNLDSKSPSTLAAMLASKKRKLDEVKQKTDDMILTSEALISNIINMHEAPKIVFQRNDEWRKTVDINRVMLDLDW
jgi:hypothetical protein